MNPFALVPLLYRLFAFGLLTVSLVGFGWVKGACHVQDQWDAANNKQALQVSGMKQRQAESTVQVITKYVDRINVVRETGEAIIKEVPIYVSPEVDSACMLPRSFVLLHDAAAAGSISESTGDADASPAGVALSTVARTLSDNYERDAMRMPNN